MLLRIIERSRIVLLPIVAVAMVIIYVLLFNEKRVQSVADVTRYVQDWQAELANEVFERSPPTLIKKVASGLQVYPVSEYTVKGRGLIIDQWKADNKGTGDSCEIPQNFQLLVGTVPIGEITLCISNQKLHELTLLSPSFLPMALIAIFLFAIGAIVPLFGYKTRLMNLLTALKVWSNDPLTNLDTSKHNDAIEKGFVELVKSGTESRLQLVETRAQLDMAKELTDMASQLAHDMRSPVSVLVSIFSSSNVSEMNRKLADDQFASLKTATSTWLKSRRERIQKNMIGPTDVSGLIDSIVAGKRIQYPRIEFSVVNTAKGYAKCSPGQLSIILSNIIDNAAQAITHSNGKVSLVVSTDAEKILIAIEDNGGGIPPHILPYIFEDNFTFGKIDGNGLGLSDARKKVSAWGGKIEVDSVENNGTRFGILLQRNLNTSEGFA